MVLICWACTVVYVIVPYRQYESPPTCNKGSNEEAGASHRAYPLSFCFFTLLPVPHKPWWWARHIWFLSGWMHPHTLAPPPRPPEQRTHWSCQDFPMIVQYVAAEKMLLGTIRRAQTLVPSPPRIVMRVHSQLDLLLVHSHARPRVSCCWKRSSLCPRGRGGHHG